MTELKDGKIKKIRVDEKGIGITIEKKIHMSQDFLRMRYRILGEAMDSIKAERAKIKEIAKTAKIKLD